MNIPEKSDSSTKTKLSKIEFDVNLSCNSCSEAVRNALQKVSGIETLNISIKNQSVVVETVLPSQAIKEVIESTGKRAVLKGIGSTQDVKNLGSAVAELKGPNNIFGVIRFHQIEKEKCIIDGTIDGLTPGKHGFHLYEYGDLSEGCNNLGSHFNPSASNHGGPNNKERHYGDLGNISADNSGRASFRLEDDIIKVGDIIGRSVAVTSDRDDLGCGGNVSSKIDGNSGQRLACAIIARSAGLFENPKRFCQCDGVSIWDETETDKKQNGKNQT